MFPSGPMIWMAVVWSIALAFISVVLWALLTLLKVYHQPTHESPDKALPEVIATGREPLWVVGAIAGG